MNKKKRTDIRCFFSDVILEKKKKICVGKKIFLLLYTLLFTQLDKIIECQPSDSLIL